MSVELKYITDESGPSYFIMADILFSRLKSIKAGPKLHLTLRALASVSLKFHSFF